jgi:hypothetical protein
MPRTDPAPLHDGEIVSIDTVPDRFGRWRIVAQVHTKGTIHPMLLVGPTTGDGGPLKLVPTDEFELVSADAAAAPATQATGAVTSDGVPKRR